MNTLNVAQVRKAIRILAAKKVPEFSEEEAKAIAQANAWTDEEIIKKLNQGKRFDFKA